MENLGIAGLIAAYVALAVILLSLLMFATLRWWIKGAAIVLVTAFYFVSYASIPQILGWPTPYGLPKRMYLIAVTIEEPTAVYLWARDLDHGLRISRPRAYKLPYSPKLHEKVDAVSRKLKRAIPVIAEVAGGDANATIGEGYFNSPGEIDINFVDAPEALIPGKE